MLVGGVEGRSVASTASKSRVWLPCDLVAKHDLARPRLHLPIQTHAQMKDEICVGLVARRTVHMGAGGEALLLLVPVGASCECGRVQMCRCLDHPNNRHSSLRGVTFLVLIRLG